MDITRVRRARHFECARRRSATGFDGKPVEVWISGHQTVGGEIDAGIVAGGDTIVNPTNARALAADLLAAAGEREALR